MKRVHKFIILSLISITISGCGYVPTGSVTQGIRVDDIDLSGKSKAELHIALEQLGKEKNKPVTIVTDKTNTQATWKDLGILENISELEQDILSYGYEDDALTLLSNRFKALVYGKQFPYALKLDEVQAQAFLTEFAKTMDTPGHDAYLSVENGQVVLHPAKNGKRIDIATTMKALKESVATGNINTLSLVYTTENTVKVTDADLKSLTTVLASYTTSFDPSNTNRTNNIEIAANKMNGTLVKPGQNFSFNEVVGERTAEAGFDDAPVMIDGKLVPGIGGGICQVSSTLFNAALLSGMEIVERNPHFEPVGYIAAGRDATVAYGYLDFIFKNPYNQSVYVITSIFGGEVTIYIIGVGSDKPKSVDISVGGEKEIPHSTETRTDMTIEGGQVIEGHPGLTMVTTRHIVYGNGVTSTDTYESLYDPVNTIIIKGKPKPTTKSPTV